VDSATKSKVEDAIAGLKKAMEGDDVNEIKRRSEELTQASHKLAETMYQQASAGDQYAGAGAGAQAGSQSAGAAPEEDVVDADFEEVKDDKK